MILTQYQYNLAIKNNDFENDSIIKSQILNFINSDGKRFIDTIETLKAYNKVMGYIHNSFELGLNQSCNIEQFKNFNL